MGAHDILLDRDVRDWVLVPLTVSIFLMMLIRQYTTQVPAVEAMSCAFIACCDNLFVQSYDSRDSPQIDVPWTAQAFMGGPSQQKVDPKELREKQALARSQLLRGSFGWLTEPAFRQRRAYFSTKVGALLRYPALRSPNNTAAGTDRAQHPTFPCSHSQDTGVFSQKSEQKSAQEQMMTNPDMMSGMMKQNLLGIIPQVSAHLQKHACTAAWEAGCRISLEEACHGHAFRWRVHVTRDDACRSRWAPL